MKTIRTLLAEFKKNKIKMSDVLQEIKAMPFKDLGFAKIDHHRHLRRGYPEVIYGAGKTEDQIIAICKNIVREHKTLLLTRVDKNIYTSLRRHIKGIEFDALSGLVYLAPKRIKKKGRILVITAGTSDLKVASEASVTARVMGNNVKLLADVGVAGVHRLLNNVKELQKANVLIVVAGMEGALPSVVSGLVAKPVIAVPTSVGYGASFKGIAPLLTMLNSCSPGVCVVNIDNGFGAGYLASMINK